MRKARAIFQNIYSSEETTEEKENAIRKVIGMETHNSFTKQEFINALDWLLNEHSKHNDWIPCSERLPEKNQSCLVSYSRNVTGKYVDIDRFDGNKFCFYGIDWVIAWQPLPAPYKEGVTENE